MFQTVVKGSHKPMRDLSDFLDFPHLLDDVYPFLDRWNLCVDCLQSCVDVGELVWRHGQDLWHSLHLRETRVKLSAKLSVLTINLFIRNPWLLWLWWFSEVSLIRDNQGRETVWLSKGLIIKSWKVWFSLIMKSLILTDKVFTKYLPSFQFSRRFTGPNT
jgi:hypothetical protein